jgi:SAM-dependent methyltransferase
MLHKGITIVTNSDSSSVFRRVCDGAHWVLDGLRRRVRHADIDRPSTAVGVTFDSAAFRHRIRYRDNYQTISASLLEIVEFTSVLDLGCANGFLLEDFIDSGKDVRGVELSPEVRDVLPGRLHEKVMIADAVTLGKIGAFDLVCCVEVAEHVPPESSYGLIDTIVANASKWIYFTAASPCQPGHGHVNCRQQFFWLNEFRKRGVSLDWERTEQFLAAIKGLQPAEWLEWNSLILRK